MMRQLLFVGCVLAAAGCGSSTASVSGNVTLDGNALDTGNVAFHPVGEGPTATGSIDSSGNYTLKVGAGSGVPPGEYVVVVVATRIEEPKPGDIEEKVPERITPAIYASKETTPFKFKLEPGSNTCNLELKSQ